MENLKRRQNRGYPWDDRNLRDRGDERRPGFAGTGTLTGRDENNRLETVSLPLHGWEFSQRRGVMQGRPPLALQEELLPSCSLLFDGCSCIQRVCTGCELNPGDRLPVRLSW